MNTNVDPAELAKFSELAHRWWDTNSEFRPLHQINPLRLDWIQGFVPLKDKQVLDVCSSDLERQTGAGRGLRRRHPERRHGPRWRSRNRH